MERDPLFDTDAITQWSYDVGLFGFMNSAWGWPIIESLHFLGLSLLIGTVGLFDLRMLGCAKSLSLSSLHAFIPVGVAGFFLNVVTGTMFVLSAPAQYIHNPAFQLKVACLLIAGINMVVFYRISAAAVLEVGATQRVPTQARIFAAVSLAAWIGVITFGRLLTFFRPPYHWCAWCGLG